MCLNSEQLAVLLWVFLTHKAHPLFAPTLFFFPHVDAKGVPAATVDVRDPREDFIERRAA